ncbi:MAG: hypothetical protein JOZ73_03965 [Solirubrobacterales bacterium]|nr:hypothetical protein [Solirubrobacterales bacterium]
MNRIVASIARGLKGLWEFLVGDDPLVAAGVALALALTAALARWWVMPLAVLALLASSLRRAAR